MTQYLVIPANRETALRAAYLGENIPSESGDMEAIGKMVLEGNGIRKITGSSRASVTNVDNLRVGNAPWLEIVDEWPADWVYAQ